MALDHLHHLLADALRFVVPLYGSERNQIHAALAAYDAAKSAPIGSITACDPAHNKVHLDAMEAQKAAPAELNMTPGPLVYQCGECELLKAECYQYDKALRCLSAAIGNPCIQDECDSLSHGLVKMAIDRINTLEAECANMREDIDAKIEYINEKHLETERIKDERDRAEAECAKLREELTGDPRTKSERANDSQRSRERELEIECAKLRKERDDFASSQHYWMHEALGRETDGDDRDGEIRRLAEECAKLREESANVYKAMGPGTIRFMDPPDGGSPTQAEMVGHMLEQLHNAENECAKLRGEVKAERALHLDSAGGLRDTLTQVERDLKIEKELRMVAEAECAKLREERDQSDRDFEAAEIERCRANERATRAEAECAKLQSQLDSMDKAARRWQDHAKSFEAECAKLRDGYNRKNKNPLLNSSPLLDANGDRQSATVPRETYEDEVRDKERWKEKYAEMLLRADAEAVARERAEARLEAMTGAVAVEAGKKAWFMSVHSNPVEIMKEALAAARAEVCK